MSKEKEFDFSGRFKDEYKNERNSISAPNIIIMGATGVGKSSLVNMVFGSDLAKVGEGVPQTRGVKAYRNDLVQIYDSEGYEHGGESQSRYKEQVMNFISDQSAKIVEKIHLAWYCISLPGHRVLDVDINTIKSVMESGIPVLAVFTKADEVSDKDEEDMRKALQSKIPGMAMVSVSEGDDVGEPIENLIDWSYNNLDESLRRAFAAAARRAIVQKREQSKIIYLQHGALAATAAASPIPFSDAPILMGVQTAMIARIASVWDMASLEKVVGGSFVTQLATIFGRTLVGNLVKLIPGVGTAAGALINGTVASSITVAMGWAISEIAEKVTSDQLAGKEVSFEKYMNPEMFSALVTEYLKKERG